MDERVLCCFLHSRKHGTCNPVSDRPAPMEPPRPVRVASVNCSPDQGLGGPCASYSGEICSGQDLRQYTGRPFCPLGKPTLGFSYLNSSARTILFLKPSNPLFRYDAAQNPMVLRVVGAAGLHERKSSCRSEIWAWAFRDQVID